MHVRQREKTFSDSPAKGSVGQREGRFPIRGALKLSWRMPRGILARPDLRLAHRSPFVKH